MTGTSVRDSRNENAIASITAKAAHIVIAAHSFTGMGVGVVKAVRRPFLTVRIDLATVKAGNAIFSKASDTPYVVGTR